MANGRVAMPIPLRRDFQASQLRLAARRTKDGPQVRRLLALAAIYEGATRSEAARIGGGTLQIVRDWVLKFNAQGPQGLIERKAPGQPSRVKQCASGSLAGIVETRTKHASGRRTRLRDAGRGAGPFAPQDQRTASPYIFGAICPRDGKVAGLV